MRRRLADAWLDRWIERELLHGLSPRRRAWLHARLRADPRARARYDRAVTALRVLEGDAAVASVELELVGRWLAGDADPRPEGAARRAFDGRLVPAAVAAVVAALVILWVGPLRELGALRPWTEGHDGWGVRGGEAGALALEVLCGPDDTPDPELRVRECRPRDLMGFGYRVPQGTHGTLTLFGIDADGDPMYYLPTPVDPAGVTVEPGHWRALRLAIRLRVNHAPGPLRVYGLVAPRVATTQEVAAWVEQLAPQPAAAPGDRPWTERVDPQRLQRLCATSTDCAAAELALDLRP
ncbi:MAG: hypothetical protein KDK70_35625 [Myxococcales bacterium]|nr:hypothetical protein [Myxococcales bacterium]